MNILHIINGWFYSIIWTPKKAKKLSEERLVICNSCEYAVESSFLKVLPNRVEKGIERKCSICTCPTYEKSLVKNENCPKSFWKI